METKKPRIAHDGEEDCEYLLVIRPARVNSGGEFAEQILADLIDDGLSGNELLEEFKKRQAKVRPAVEAIIAEAENVARGKGEYFTYDDVFGAEDKEIRVGHDVRL